jgi:hypothetical protein
MKDKGSQTDPHAPRMTGRTPGAEEDNRLRDLIKEIDLSMTAAKDSQAISNFDLKL